MERMQYPSAPIGQVIEKYHGASVPDPYRALEELAAEQTLTWVAAQQELTNKVLADIPGRDGLLARLKQVINYERLGPPVLMGGRLFYTRNSGLQNQAVLYVEDAPGQPPRMLLDPNTWSDDGTVALMAWQVSDDVRRLLYAVSSSGSDWMEWRVLDIETCTVLEDRIQWSKGGGQWGRDGVGFFYGAYPRPSEDEVYTAKNREQKIYFHVLGTPQAEDRLVFDLPEHPDWYFGARVNEERDLLAINIAEPGSPNNRLCFIQLDVEHAPLLRLFDANDAQYGFVARHSGNLLVLTSYHAPRQRLVAVDPAHPEPEHWVDVIPEREMTLTSVTTAGGYLFANYLKDAHNVIYQYTPDGTLVGEVKLPGPGTAYGFDGRKHDRQTYFTYMDLVTPTSIYRFNIDTRETELFRRPEVPMDLAQFETRQVFYRAPDGMAIPLLLVHRKGLQLDGSHPTILYGYGGFNSAMQPVFSTTICAWVELGGVYAIACIRGGGEYGEAWHLAATKTHKQVSFDDFIAGAQFLIDQGYTNSARLAIWGHSNGGLLVGAVMTQRPELCAVALPGVGVMDMLRFNRFGYGSFWEADYGSPDNAEEFRALLAYSPYHNLRPGVEYPATLVATADTDDRVMPGHSYKFAARLQACQAEGSPPVLIRIETSAGHGAGKPLDKTLGEICDNYAFALHYMGLELAI